MLPLHFSAGHLSNTEQMRSVTVTKDFAHEPLSWDPATHLETTFQLTNLQKPDSLASYASYLRELYSSMSQSRTSQHWTHLPRCEFIQLAMIGSEPGIRRGDREEEMVRLAQQGRIETILDYKQPIDFDDLFPIPCQIPLVVLPPPRRLRVLLIEGAPGGGKSTFALYFCQKWASQNSSASANFDLVILVYLRDEAIQNATTLAGILPIDSTELSQAVADHIKSTHGRNVLFIFDGWDEFPLHLQDSSIVATIIKEPHRISLHQSTVLITSRPVSSGNLLHIADRRVEILGFTQLQIREYIEKALDGNSTRIQKLIQHLEDHPVIEGYCYLPLHVAILVHVFLTMKGALPTTLHELFCNLVLCCIVRELQTHKEKTLSAVSWSSLDDLPDDLKFKLNDLCLLAFEGVMQNKVVFNPKDLHNFHLPANLPSLGLLQAVEGLTLLSKSLSHNFLHLSVQELLAAYHISHMESSEQLEVFKRMFDSSRFQAVLHYYSGFTKLANPKIREFISSYAKQANLNLKTLLPLPFHRFEEPIKQANFINALLPLFHCFYEAQEPSLCKLVIHESTKCIAIQLHVDSSQIIPVDYLAIGYITASLLSVPASSNIRLKIIAIDDHRLKLLLFELIKHPLQNSDGRQLCLEFCKTTFTLERAKLIASLLENSAIVSELKLAECKIREDSFNALVLESLQNEKSHLHSLQVLSSTFEHTSMCQGDKLPLKRNWSSFIQMRNFVCDIFEVLQHNTALVQLRLSNTTQVVASKDTALALTEMLKVNKTLERLDLSDNFYFTTSGAYHVFVGLQCNTHLVYLNLSKISLEVIEITAQALITMLQVNKTLQHLDLSRNCLFSDKGAQCVSEGLQHNTALLHLNLSNTGIMDEGAEYIAQALKSNRSLQILDISHNQISDKGLDCIDKSKINTSLSILRIYQTRFENLQLLTPLPSDEWRREIAKQHRPFIAGYLPD